MCGQRRLFNLSQFDLFVSRKILLFNMPDDCQPNGLVLSVAVWRIPDLARSQHPAPPSGCWLMCRLLLDLPFFPRRINASMSCISQDRSTTEHHYTSRPVEKIRCSTRAGSAAPSSCSSSRFTSDGVRPEWPAAANVFWCYCYPACSPRADNTDPVMSVLSWTIVVFLACTEGLGLISVLFRL
jgi:hypothetical protein